MEKMIHKIVAVPINYVIIALIVLFYFLEQLNNSPFKFKKRADHLFNNFVFQVIIIAINFFSSAVLVFCIQWIADHHAGLFNTVHLPFIIKLIFGIAALDLTAYWFHRLSHKISVLWLLHRVHHSDTTMDCSTFFRHHPFEVVVSTASIIIGSFIFGIDIITLGVYILLLIIFMIAQHANIEFPRWIDKFFSGFITTPALHKIHHEQNREFTDSNYADIFIFWDRLFGTYKYLPHNQIKFGLTEFDADEKQTCWYLLKSPFLRNEKDA